VGIDPIDVGRRRAVFLDRDGVLNRAVVREGKPYPPDSAANVEILTGVADALADLKAASFLLLVVTNQPDVAQGTQSRSAVEAIHQRLQAELPLDAIFVCYHQDSDRCRCRKPAPGLLEEAAARYELYLPCCFMVGDRWRDIDAGCRAGCQSILVDYGYTERAPEWQPVARVASLREAADWILRQQQEDKNGIVFGAESQDIR
jgi:D-glycero-D-manno-heptose 1,7-bisphosphate phosphatase